jgi:hypothetical protein
MRPTAETALRTAFEAGVAHQLGHFVPPAGLAPGEQLAVYFARPVHALAFQMHLANKARERTVSPHCRTLAPMTPVVVAAARDRQQAAHHPDWILIAASVDTAVSHFDSLAKYLAASFKKSPN